MDPRYLFSSLALTLVAFEGAALAVRSVASLIPAAPLLLTAFPLAGLAMYTRLAVGFGPMIVQLLLLSLIVQFATFGSPALALTTFVSGLAGGVFARMRPSRSSMVIAGLMAGLATLILAAFLAPPDLTVARELGRATAALIGGVLSGAAVLTLSPVAERLYSHVTPLTLLEVLSYEHPLLRRLMASAPGTFLHSINVALLADAAARAIGADSLAVRVGALYHDVGKTEAPEYFVENQRADNVHDRLSPEESAQVIRSHVPDGIRLVKRYRLGRTVEACVQEHHGTSVMGYFAGKANATGAGVDAFRYPGPRPQSKETGLLMIADQLEATARATSPATLDACRDLVATTIEHIDSDDQLADSGLRPRDMTTVSEVFAQMIHAMYHHRIAYPTAEPPPPRLRLPRFARPSRWPRQ